MNTEAGADNTLQTLRRSLRASRNGLRHSARQLADERLCQRIAQLDVFARATRIAAFLPFDGEADLRPLLAEHTAKDWFLPILPGPGQPLSFAPFRHGDSLVNNRFDIPEPMADPAGATLPASLELVLTPLVGFDSDMRRLGVGGGFYDRSFEFLNAAPRGGWPYLLGVAYEIQQVDQALPERPWDIKLDAVATDCNLYLPR